MKSFFYNLKTIVNAFQFHLKFILTERLFFINSIIVPMGLSIMFYFIYSGHTDNVIFFAVIKAGLLGLWGANIWGASFILEGEKRLGTIDYLMVSPHSIYFVLIGKALAVSFASNVSFIVSLIWAQIFVGSIWVFFSIYQIALIMIVCTFAFSCVGLLVGVCFISFRQPEILIQFLTYPVYLLSGIAVTIEVFPKYIQYISKLIPLYWAQRGIQEILIYKENLTILTVLLLSGGCYLIGAALILQRVERRARWTGDFSKY